MNNEQFAEVFAEDIVMVDVEEITPATKLEDLEDWDSMAIVALNASLDEHYGFTLNEDEIKSLTKFEDILNFIEVKSIKK